MNHLAHLYLSRSNDELMVGNFIADEVKGKHFDHFPKIVTQGIRMHRTIDTFTDSHPVALHTKNFFKPKFRLYSSVLVDMIYDHMLAKHWRTFYDKPLEEFAQQSYDVLTVHEKILPEFSVFFLNRMMHYNWLCMYASEEGIDSVIRSMAKRIQQEGKFDGAVDVYRDNATEIEKDFFEFFPLLQKEVEPFLIIE